ncbi:hypothetical protein HJG60_011197 [Phyllostomus discolor]|uniref:Uncharacterized protein n=1 Tax=Phyllostomus discolor TaxID=89673 RepID=A0A834E560_9CHIR|nr:hypothetical protein HJG60_011197 [Phyllostomus discolor]
MKLSGLIREILRCPQLCHYLSILGPDKSHSYCFKCQHYFFIFVRGALINEYCWLLKNRQSILFKAQCLQRIFSLFVIVVNVFLKVLNSSFPCLSTYSIHRHCVGSICITSFKPHDNFMMWVRLVPFCG